MLVETAITSSVLQQFRSSFSLQNITKQETPLKICIMYMYDNHTERLERTVPEHGLF